MDRALQVTIATVQVSFLPWSWIILGDSAPHKAGTAPTLLVTERPPHTAPCRLPQLLTLSHQRLAQWHREGGVCSQGL